MADDLHEAGLAVADLDLPAGWQSIRLGDILRQQFRKVIVRPDAEYTRLGVRWYGDGPFVKEPTAGSEISGHHLYRVAEDDLIYNRLFAWKGSFGVVPPELDGQYVSNEFPTFQVDRARMEPEYLWRWFCLPAVWSICEDKSSGSTRTSRLRFKEEDLLRLVVPAPPLSEQRAIAHALRAVQRSREATEAVIAATRELKQSLLRHLFTYGPVPVEQADQVRLAETEIGPVPEHWTVTTLGDVARIERGKFSHRPRNDPRFYGGTIPFIQTGDVAGSGGRITRYTQTLNDLGLSVSRVFQKGTILLTIAANIGHTGILEFDSAFPDSLVGITPEPTVDTCYLLHYLQTQQAEMDRLAPRGTQKNINIQFLKPWPAIVPPLHEQKLIAQALEAVRHKLTVELERAQALDALLTSLLDHLMAGKVRVHDLMPTLEAAGVG